MRLIEVEMKERKIELARKIGISPQFLNQILKGERHLPIDKAVALLEAGYSVEAIKELLSPKNKFVFDKLIPRKTPAGVR
ncbi:helix-turn-helix domain-containing protein [Desulfurobacterium sp.]